MRILGIVAEYNPFHSGHLHHLTQSQQLVKPDATVAVMSGCFTQRGEPAMVDKWTRAQMALENGIDLVVELPVAWATRSAAFFAEGAVRLLAALGATDICFGSESNNLGDLQQAAKVLLEESPLFRQTLRAELSSGQSFAAAQDQALRIAGSLVPAGLFAAPNNTLAVHYLQAIIKHQLNLQPHAILRSGSYLSLSLDTQFPSAKAIRLALEQGQDPVGMPESTVHLLQQAQAAGQAPVTWADFQQQLIYRLRQLNSEQMLEFPESGEGLGERVWQAARCTNLLPELVVLSKTKRFARTRLQRLLTYILLDLRKTDLRKVDDGQTPPYARVLAINTKNGAARQLLKQTQLPVIFSVGTNETTDRRALHCLQLDTEATDCYSLAWKTGSKAGLDWTTPVVTDKTRN